MRERAVYSPRAAGRRPKRSIRRLTLALAAALLLLSPSAGVGAREDVGGRLSSPIPPTVEDADAPDAGLKLTFCFQGKPPETRLVVVDKSRQRIMVLRYLGQLVLEYEYPCATGTNPGHKQKKGDERTPVGIYFTTHRFMDNKITIFGKKAIHLNYPNPKDQIAGHKGDGIYIHGTNQTLRPRSTNGCIAMRNEDLDRIFPLIKEQVTPVVVVQSFDLADLQGRVMACDELRKLERAPLDRAETVLDTYLTLPSDDRSGQKKLAALAPRVTLLGREGGRRIKKTNLGYILLGLGDDWVLAVDQQIAGPGRKRMRLMRRYYFSGKTPSTGRLLRRDWVTPDLASARRLASWAPRIQPKPKPAVAAAASRPTKPLVSPEKAVRKMLARWLRAWNRKNIRAYISYYDRSFKSGKMGRRAWRRRKAYLNRVYKIIRVRAKNVKVTVKGARARVSFTQHYRSDWHRDVGRKDLALVLRRGRWRIVSETWTAAPKRAGASSAGGGSS